MNKKVIICIGLVFVAAILVVLNIIISNNSGNNELELTYTTNGGTPYKWEYTIEDESIVKFVKTKDITPEENKKLAGGPVNINYIFKGVKKGKTTITFKYINTLDGTVEKEEKVNVKVDKYKNISLNPIS